jgi:hypothetical protein
MGSLTVREVGLVNPGKIRFGELRDLEAQFGVKGYDCHR